MSLSALTVRGKVSGSLDSMKDRAALWLRQGLSPQRLALSLALGFAVGCIPLVGIPTLVCAALAVVLGLNQPAIQAVNYAVMPLQILLIVPLVRFGGWLVASRETPALHASELVHVAPVQFFTQMGSLAGQALLGWVILAVPTVLLLTGTLTLVLRRIPALAASESGD